MLFCLSIAAGHTRQRGPHQGQMTFMISLKFETFDSHHETLHEMLQVLPCEIYVEILC